MWCGVLWIVLMWVWCRYAVGAETLWDCTYCTVHPYDTRLRLKKKNQTNGNWCSSYGSVKAWVTSYPWRHYDTVIELAVIIKPSDLREWVCIRKMSELELNRPLPSQLLHDTTAHQDDQFREMITDVTLLQSIIADMEKTCNIFRYLVLLSDI